MGWQYCGVTMPPATFPHIGPRPPAGRVLPGLGVVLAVLLLHAALLGLLPRTVGAPAAGLSGVAARPLQVRQLVMARPAAETAAESATEAATATANAAATEPAVEATPARSPPSRRMAAQGTAPPAAAPDVLAAPAATPAQQPDSEALAGAPGEAPPLALPTGTPLPTYATRLPPAATLQYTVQRGGTGPGTATGPAREGLQAQLIWRPEATTYTLSLGVGAVGSASVGALDLHGIAPERHVETRRGREVRAANFQRQAGADGETAGRITFSGPRTEHPLLPGVQDRLSWMLQLAGVIAADPALGQPGRELTLLVVGVRGDAALWVFRVMAVQSLQLPAGEVLNAVHLVREPQRPFDTRVDVWLDPARHHLPVRLRLQNRADGPGTEFELLRLSL